MKEKYFIHLLDTPVGKYIYDVNTNSIIETREETFEYLKCGKKIQIKWIEIFKK